MFASMLFLNVFANKNKFLFQKLNLLQMDAKLALLHALKSVLPQETYVHKKDTIIATTHANNLITNSANMNNYVSKKLMLIVLQNVSKILVNKKIDVLLNQFAMSVSKENQVANVYSIKLKMDNMLTNI